MDYFLSIVGTTSTGKTDFSYNLAKFFISEGKTKGVVILSADSRQVYRDLNILSGADIPLTFVEKSDEVFLYNYFSSPDQPLSIHGQDVIEADKEWSIAHFKTLAENIAHWCVKHDYLLLVVGGTGLYHQHLTSQDAQLVIPPNDETRNRATMLTIAELQDWVKEQQPEKLAQMNNSDRHNPRRLIRVLEKSRARTATITPSNSFLNKHRHITIGLKRPIEEVAINIETRIKNRFQLGVVEEVECIISKYGVDIPAASTLGFKQLSLLIQEKIDLEQCVELWKTKELQYAKRQLTWWKKYAPTFWLDANEAYNFTEVIDLIEQSKQ